MEPTLGLALLVGAVGRDKTGNVNAWVRKKHCMARQLGRERWYRLS